MSFDLAIGDILQYAYNLFGSFLPLIYLFAGASFAIFILFAVISRIRHRE